MRYRQAAIAVVDHALDGLTDDCIRGIAQKFRKGKSALLDGELERVKTQVSRIVQNTRANYPKAPAARRRYR